MCFRRNCITRFSEGYKFNPRSRTGAGGNIYDRLVV